MRERDIKAAVAAANPVSRDAVMGLALGSTGRNLIGGRNLLAAISTDSSMASIPTRSERVFTLGRYFSGRSVALAAAMGLVAALLIAIGSGKGPAGAPEPALGAGLQRLAKVSPPILLAAPGWRVERADEAFASEGSTQFFHGSRLLSELKAEGLAGEGLQQTAELRWVSIPLETRVRQVKADGAVLVKTAIALGAEARIYAYPIGPGDSLAAIALWGRGGRVLEFRSYVPDIAAFERRLAALRGVDKGTWLEALPRRVVKTEAGVAVSRTNGWEAVVPRAAPESDFQPRLFQPKDKKESR
jgi:hypothetical protein